MLADFVPLDRGTAPPFQNRCDMATINAVRPRSKFYSVHIHGDQARAVASELRDTLRGIRADYTGHPIFFVKTHRLIVDFTSVVTAMLPEGHEATVLKISKAGYEWEKTRRRS